MKTLIVLDLNGFLVHRSSNKIVVRKNARQFILNLSKKYTVAIWSSALLKNIYIILKYFMSSVDMKSISFILSQKDCELIEYQSRRNPKINKYVLLKNISTIHEMFPLKFSKILFIDDSVKKMKNNPIYSYHIVKTWYGQEEETIFLDNLEINIDNYIKFFWKFSPLPNIIESEEKCVENSIK